MFRFTTLQWLATCGIGLACLVGCRTASPTKLQVAENRPAAAAPPTAANVMADRGPSIGAALPPVVAPTQRASSVEVSSSIAPVAFAAPVDDERQPGAQGGARGSGNLSDQRSPSDIPASPSGRPQGGKSQDAEAPVAVAEPQVAVPCPTCPSQTQAIPPSAYLDMAARGACVSPWRPPGIVGPWPRDEYICDGGDHDPPAGVTAKGRAVGLVGEDTIVQYQTRDGRARTQASNRVCIYAPRFAAVRKIYGTVQLDQREGTAGVEQPVALERIDDVAASNTYVQPLQPGRYLGTKNASRLLAENRYEPIDNVQAAAGTQGRWLPYEDLLAIQRGVIDNSEKARLAAKLEAAIQWSKPQAVQVVIDGQLAAEASGRAQAEEVLRYELPDGKRRLRVIKIASRGDAEPGDEISFTLRVDNVGDLPVEQATILDDLTARLEYVEGSAQCSAKHEFKAEPNRQGSMTLRWDIDKTLPVGEGVIIRFRCKVR